MTKQAPNRERDNSIQPPAKSAYNTIPMPPRPEDRPTEDDLARATLGGPKGSPELPAAPLTNTEDEQNLPNNEPGHVA